MFEYVESDTIWDVILADLVMMIVSPPNPLMHTYHVLKYYFKEGISHSRQISAFLNIFIIKILDY